MTTDSQVKQNDDFSLMKSQYWQWKHLSVNWTFADCRPIEHANQSNVCILFVHGFGANINHWRHNLKSLSEIAPCYAIDLIGFGQSDQPRSRLRDEVETSESVQYGFSLWGEQVVDFCQEVIQKPVLLIGNSVGGVVSLKAAQLLGSTNCYGIILIDCAQRLMDDKQLEAQPIWMRWIRPLLKSFVRQRWLSSALFHNAARPSIIRKILNQAYPTRSNVDDELVQLLYKPTRRDGASEAFRGFINLFNDDLAPELMKNLKIPIDLIWGEEDPWEPLQEAKRWTSSIQPIRSLSIIKHAGHCPHDEKPCEVNNIIKKIYSSYFYFNQTTDMR